jgi:zinc transport system ATP-binding protein
MLAVKVQDIGVRFGEFQALEAVSFAVPTGAFVAILGPNGAGKSTLLKVLLGVETASGSAEILEQSVKRLPMGWVGYVPQVKSFDRSFPALAIEAVVSGLRGSWPFRITPPEAKQASQILEQVGAGALAHKRLGRLSGGEVQRVYLARALIRKPKVLLLDEPATGVDAIGEADLYRNLEHYQQQSGATILMITHDWEAAQHHASAVLLLNRRVVAYGTPREVMRHECLAQAFGHVGHKHGKHASLGDI